MDLLDVCSYLEKPLTINEVLKTNQESQKHGLILSADEAQDIIETRNRALKNYGRLELGTGTVKKIITVFCVSPYMSSENYVLTINELVEIFYYMKNETEDLMGDDELISMMKEIFDSKCQGSLELLKKRVIIYAGKLKAEPAENEHW